MKKLIIYLVILVPYFSYGQEKKIPEEILCTPVLLQTNIAQGSGIFMADSIFWYFVTARHCLFSFDTIKRGNKLDSIFKFLPLTGKLTFYSHNTIKDKQSIIDIDLIGSFNDSLINFDKKNDIAVIIIGKRQKVNDSLAAINYTKFVKRNNSSWIHGYPINLTRKYEEANIGSDIYLFGYPGSIGLQQSPKFDYLRPLLRKGIIAGKYEKNKTIIIDAPSYFGNSGGPVFEAIENEEGSYIRLFGIITEYIPYFQLENKSNGTVNIQIMNSGYSIVTSIDYALDLIKKLK